MVWKTYGLCIRRTDGCEITCFCVIEKFFTIPCKHAGILATVYQK